MRTSVLIAMVAIACGDTERPQRNAWCPTEGLKSCSLNGADEAIGLGLCTESVRSTGGACVLMTHAVCAFDYEALRTSACFYSWKQCEAAKPPGEVCRPDVVQ